MKKELKVYTDCCTQKKTNKMKRGRNYTLYSSILVLFICLFSCVGKNKVNKPDIEFSSVKTDSFYLESSVRPIDLIFPQNIIAIDTFLILIQYKEEKMISIFSLNTNNHLTTVLRKGNGPDEFPMIKRSNQFVFEDGEVKFWVNAFPNYFCLLNVNKSVKEDRVVFDKRFKFPGDFGSSSNILAQSNCAYCFEDSSLWLSRNSRHTGDFLNNPNYTFVEYDYKLKQIGDTIPLFDFADLTDHDELIVASTEVCHLTQKKTAIFYLHMGCFNIIDYETKQAKKIETKKDGSDHTKIMNAKKTEHYIASASADHIWVLRGYQDSKPIVDVYDWEGLLKGTVFFDKWFVRYHINPTTNMLYAIGEDDQILEYDLASVKI